MPASKPMGTLVSHQTDDGTTVMLLVVPSEDVRCTKCHFGPESCHRHTVCCGLGRDDDQMVELRVWNNEIPPGTVFPWIDNGENIILESVESTPGLLCQSCHFSIDNCGCKSNHPVWNYPDYDVYFVKR